MDLKETDLNSDLDKDLSDIANTDSEQSLETEEPTLTQSKVNELIGAAKRTAYEKAKREIMEEAQRAQALEEAQAKQTEPAVPSQAQAPQFDEQQLYEGFREKILREQEEERLKQEQEERAIRVNQIAEQYFSKMSGGAEKFEDFEDVMKDFDPSQFKELVLLAAQMDNTDAIMYELNKNPQSLATISYYAKDGNYKFAQKLLDELDKSIVNNQQALQNNRSANQPLDRLTPSPGSGVDGSAMTIKDFKAKYRT